MQNYRYNCGASCRRGERTEGKNNCLCTDQPVSLAMAYVKDQQYGKTYEPGEALGRGTLFPDLYMPFSGGCGR